MSATAAVERSVRGRDALWLAAITAVALVLRL
jgi:hypothetical protein